MRLAIIALCLALAAPAFAKSRGPSFIYVRGANQDTLMSGQLDDLERVRKALGKQDRALWVRTPDDKEYIIRDTATLDELERLWKPANELAQQLGKLGAEQGKLGEQLGKLGEQQGRIGEQQGRIGEQQGRLAEHQAQLAARLANATDAQRKALEREMRDLDAKMSELDKQMRELDKPMRELEKQMRVFDKPMRALDKQMREIEPKHEAASKQAETGMAALVSRAINSGLAKPF